MTSGDKAGGAGAPAGVATPRPSAEGPAPERAMSTARPSAAELCQDSDDLLTGRRGLAAAPSQAAAPTPAAEEAGIPFSAPPFDGGAVAATPFPSEVDGAAAAAESLDGPSAETSEAAWAEASDRPAPERAAASVAAEPPAPETAAVEASLPVDSPSTATGPATDTLEATDAATTAELPSEAAPATITSTERQASQEPPAAETVASPVDSTESASAAEALPAGGVAGSVAQMPDQPESVTGGAESASSVATLVSNPLEDSPVTPLYNPYAALPVPEDVEQAAVASQFVAWLPDDSVAEDEAPWPAAAADADAAGAPAEAATANDGASAASLPTMGVPLLTALGLNAEGSAEHTNGHAARNGTALDPVAPTTVAPLLHEQETREVRTEPGAGAEPAAESSSGATPTAAAKPSPSPSIEETSALIAEMLAPSAPAGAIAVADPPLSVVALPSGSETPDAVIELPRADALGSEAEPVAIAAPPAEPPSEPPAPPASSSPPPPPPASPLPEEGEEEGATMTIIEHLEELRKRITVAAISIVVGAVFSWFFVPHFVNLLETDVRSLGFHFVNLSPLGPLGLNIKLAFVGGLIIASPIVFYEIWAFVAPGLTRKERRYALPFSLIGGALFALGAATAIVIIPLALRFLVSFFPVFDLEQLLDINQYIMFITLIAVIFGITFELPIFMVGFSILGIASSRFFIQKFKIALFIIYGAAMVITPGADFVSPIVLGTFLVALYWLGVLLIRFIGK